ncbi:hypothetical protein BMF94_6852 [Rhodotorula taiwanensis]|uniref:SRR1-like domain-containing protein n=1 Tax=Rhodotorula taiwanensis TaxID=741276 RepID=A0A2S5B0H0_9BASI|nr:hypothetical protein BMF94_6852 [Rhodotorula taiwanensis]
MSSPKEDDGFTFVTHKKQQASRPGRNRKGKNRFRERTLDEKLQAREAELRRSGYLEQCRKMLRDALSPASASETADTVQEPYPPPTCVVCLGLGSVSDSTKAQDQYVMLKELLFELQEELDPGIKAAFYDPVFSPEDVTFLEEQGHVVRPANHPLRLDQPTLLYIPHGPRTLFEAILAANWDSPEQLSRVILFGNRLDLYDDPTYSGSLRDRRKDVDGTGDELGESAELIAQAAKLFRILPLPSTKEHLEAFNDLALQHVTPRKSAEKPATFWRRAPPDIDEPCNSATSPSSSQVEVVEAATDAIEKLSLQ